MFSWQLPIRVASAGYNEDAIPALKITISKENYLKAIAEAESEGEPVIAATLARWLGVSAPAVTMAIRRLKRDGLIRVQATSGHIALTTAGREISSRILYRHYLIERMLTEIFGMEWYKVHEEAEQLEHAVSEEFERRLIEKLGTSAECPHGSPLEGGTPAERRAMGWMKLDELPEKTDASVTTVYERDRKLLVFLDELGLRPGARFRLDARNYDETLSLELGGRTVQLGRPAAARIWVKPVPA